MKRVKYGGDDAFLINHEKVPEEHQRAVSDLMELVSADMAPHILDIVSTAMAHMPALNNVVLLLTDKEGRPASVLGTLPPREQLAALERAVELTKLVAKATDN